MATVPSQDTPTKPPEETVEQRFFGLKDAWHRAVAHHSSSTFRNSHPAYREIIGLGPAVVPLLLRDMQEHNTHWFVALAEITGADPVPDEDAGKIRAMVEDWLRWAMEHGYRW
jgi:hypothetical protein